MLHAIVADSQTLRVFETSLTDSTLNEIASFDNQVGNQHERDLVASRPGRVVNRAAGIRQSFEPKVSAKQTLTQRWLKVVALQLQPLLEGRDSRAVILVAAPRMLADLRRHLPASVRALICTEVPRDLMHQPILELQRRLQPAVRAASGSLRSRPIRRRLSGRSARMRKSA